MIVPGIKKWQEWLDAHIRPELHTMYLHRFAWQEVSKLIADNDDLPESYWWQFMFETYSATQASAVRRQADNRRDVASLARFLMDVQKRADEVTRSYWIDTVKAPEDEIDRVLAGRDWDEHFGGGDCLDPTIPKRDLETLLHAAEDVKKYVDGNIAHISADPVARQVTLDVSDVHAAMDVCAEVLNRYYYLCTDSTFATMTPILQHDFFGVFRQPWMREGYSPSLSPFYRA